MVNVNDSLKKQTCNLELCNSKKHRDGLIYGAKHEDFRLAFLMKPKWVKTCFLGWDIDFRFGHDLNSVSRFSMTFPKKNWFRIPFSPISYFQHFPYIYTVYIIYIYIIIYLMVGGLEHVFHILRINIPTDFHIFQRGGSTTNQIFICPSWDLRGFQISETCRFLSDISGWRFARFGSWRWWGQYHPAGWVFCPWHEFSNYPLVN